MKNSEVAKILYDIADLLELQAVPFKPMAYRKAARSIDEHPEDIDQVYASSGIKGLMGIPGIGKGIAVKIEDLLKTGRMRYYDDLRSRFPPHISSLIEVPGLGPRKVNVLHEKLRISSIEDLEMAANEHRISAIKGFGRKSEEDILKGIALFRAGQKRMLLFYAFPVASEIEKRIGSLDFVKKAVVAGSFRRKNETIGDLDILAVSSYPDKVVSYFINMPEVDRVLSKGSTKSSILLRNGLQVDLRIVGEGSFGSALQYFTGDIRHNVRLREIASRKGLKLNEYGLFDKKNRFCAGRSEKEVYNYLGLEYIEPELRNDRGEVEASLKGRLPKLLQYGSIRGDLHVHTKMSDGTAGIREMADAARDLGYEYIAITDHSVSERIASGLPEERMSTWLSEIRRFARSYEGLKILAGSEVSIRADGSLDYIDSLLKKMDFVVASIHSRFKSGRKEMTARIISALENEHVDVLAHPTGRLIYRRDPLDFDLKAVFRSAVDNGVCLEINSQADRMDLKDVHVKEAKDMGARFVISTDSHSVHELKNMWIGVSIGRRGWLSADDVINTRKFRDFVRILGKGRLP
ncbi:DNA polymerase/3'-5' exonuclease PolX [Candidatus Woesearchaeota archaeon]|nr:DNA polymerase/3'-5' exonuclease PolX [Candidatus Woesearchaeota archaeon]